VRCAHVVKIYAAATGETQALRGVEAQFWPGTITAVTGPSGSGKSSLLSIIALRERATGGEIDLLGAPVTSLSARAMARARERALSWVSQRPIDSLFPHLTAREQLEQALRGHDGLDDCSSSARSASRADARLPAAVRRRAAAARAAGHRRSDRCRCLSPTSLMARRRRVGCDGRLRMRCGCRV
jgi:putative ABC transport system ATP-binding protein